MPAGQAQSTVAARRGPAHPTLAQPLAGKQRDRRVHARVIGIRRPAVQPPRRVKAAGLWSPLGAGHSSSTRRLFAFLDGVFDATAHEERLLRQIVVITVGELLERLDRLVERRETCRGCR